MYRSSNTPFLTQQQADRERNAAASDARIAEMRRTSASGRTRLFNTLVSPTQVATEMGIGSAVNVGKLQNQTAVSRASGILGLENQELDRMAQSPVSDDPEVLPMTDRPMYCASASGAVRREVQVPVPEVAGMPKRAPAIVDSRIGPMYFRGANATIPGSYEMEQQPVDTSDSSLMSWLADNPWLALALAGAGIYAMSRRVR